LVPVAVSAQRSDVADDRGRRNRHTTKLAQRRDVGLRRGVQARAGRVPSLHRRRRRAADVGDGRDARRRALPGRRALASRAAPDRESGGRCSRERGMTVSSRGTETLGRSTSVAVANAPCSYGAFEITVGLDPNVPDALTVLDEVTTAGYSGLALGPLGYLGLGHQLVPRLGEPPPALPAC